MPALSGGGNVSHALWDSYQDEFQPVRLDGEPGIREPFSCPGRQLDPWGRAGITSLGDLLSLPSMANTMSSERASV